MISDVVPCHTSKLRDEILYEYKHPKIRREGQPSILTFDEINAIWLEFNKLRKQEVI